MEILNSSGVARASGRAIGVLLVCTLFAGCKPGMGRIDRATDQAILERALSLGGSAAVPRSFEARESDSERSSRLSTSPTTVNPGVDELKFKPANEVRDLAAILERYAESATDMLDDPDARSLDLEEVLRLSVSTSREHRSAEEDFILTAISLLIEQHRWSPRLFNDTSFGIGGTGDDGSFDAALDVVNTLRVTKRLPFGGSVEARWVARAADELRGMSTNEYTSSSELVLSADVPLLRGAGAVAREDLIQAERSTVYAARDYERFRRSLAVSIARDYFRLLQSRSGIQNQIRQLESQKQRDLETQAKVKAGRLKPFETEITADAVKQSEARLANLRESYILQLERFKVRLGLAPTDSIKLGDAGLDLRLPETTPMEGVERALNYRLDLQNRRDQLLDTERAVDNAQNNLLPDFGLDVSVTVPTDPDNDQDGFEIDGDDLSYRVGATLSLPLDRRIEKLSLRQAQIRLERARRSYDEFRDGVIIEARQAVREVDLAKFQLELAISQIEINERGLEDLSLRDDADPQQILDRQNRLLDAQDARDAAETALRNAILDYLLSTGQMRVTGDGLFDPPPGMMRDDSTPGAIDEPTGTTPDDAADEDQNDQVITP